MTRPRRRQASHDRDPVLPPGAPSETRRAQEDGAGSGLSVVAQHTIRLTQEGLILTAACILVATESLLSAVARRAIRLTGRGIVLTAACIFLVALLGPAAGGPLRSDSLPPGTPAIPVQLAAAGPLVEASSTPPCPTAEGCSQQSPDGQQPGSGTTAVPTPPTAAPTATSTPVPPTAVPSAIPTPVPPTVFIDPGHGGVDLGTVGVVKGGRSVYEKDAALALAMRTADYLQADGINVVLSRTDDSLPDATRSDYTSDGAMLTPAGLKADLQRRIDRANASWARVLLSIHFNGLGDPSVAGTTTIYCGDRPFADRNRYLATLIQSTVIAALRAEGYSTPDQGVIDDEDLWNPASGTLEESYNHLALLGPAVPGKLHASNMPGALFETFYLSNPPEASAAMEPGTQDLIATALARAIEQYLQGDLQ